MSFYIYRPKEHKLLNDTTEKTTDQGSKCLKKVTFPRGKVTFYVTFPQNKLLSLTFPQLKVTFPVFKYKSNSILKYLYNFKSNNSWQDALIGYETMCLCCYCVVFLCSHKTRDFFGFLFQNTKKRKSTFGPQFFYFLFYRFSGPFSDVGG